MINFSAVPNGALTSDKYKVFIKQDCDWQELPVYLALVPNGHSHTEAFPEEYIKLFPGISYGPRAAKTYFVKFTFDGEVDIKVVFDGNAEKFVLRPEMYSVPFTVSGNTVYFSVNKPSQLSLEPDCDPIGALRIFADPYRTEDLTGYKNVIRFPKGFYSTDNCDLIKKNADGEPVLYISDSDTAVVLEEGAVLAASIEVKNRAKHIKITGSGMINLLSRIYGYNDGFELETVYLGFLPHPQPAVYIHERCDDIIIENVTLICNFRGVCIRNSENVLIDRVKLITNAENADGINSANIIGLTVKNCYVQSNDDCFAVFTSCDSITTLWDAPEYIEDSVSRDIKVTDTVFWTAARPFMIGGHSSGNTDPHDLLEGVEISDCEVLDVVNRIFETEHKQAYFWSGIFRVLSQTQGHTRNISFKNITVNWTKDLVYQPIHIAIRDSKSASYTESGGYRIDDVYFKDIRFKNVGNGVMPSKFDTYNTGTISGIRFDNVTVNGKKMTASDTEVKGDTEISFI